MVAVKILPTDLTAKECRQLFHYDPDTGVLSWRESGRGHPAGPAGGSHQCTYRQVCVKGRMYSVHRLIWLYMTGKWPNRHIDHRDRNKLNQRWSNLREATPTQNNANRPRQKNNKSGIKGVCFNKKSRKWCATVYVNRRAIHLGLFNTKDDAANVYRAEAEKHFGEFFAP